MTAIQFDNKSLALNDGETVLDGLLRHGYEIPHGCKSGVCQSCMLKAEPGTPPLTSQSGLKSTQQSQGYFLSCSCIPKEIELNISNDEQCQTRWQSKVVEISPLNDSVILLKLQVENFTSIPGQFITLWKDKSIARCYSIASANENCSVLELHIKIIPDGLFSQFVKTKLKLGDDLEIGMATGDCFYTGEDKSAPLILAGLGTGLAPLYGILRHALHTGHHGPIHLFCGAKHSSGLYLVEELQALASVHDNVKVDFIALENSGNPHVIEGSIYQHLRTEHPSTAGCRSYLCGAESFVRKLKKQIFLSGANSKDIYADAFIPFSS